MDQPDLLFPVTQHHSVLGYLTFSYLKMPFTMQQLLDLLLSSLILLVLAGVLIVFYATLQFFPQFCVENFSALIELIQGWREEIRTWREDQERARQKVVRT
jgi:hypothetical protein